MVPRLFSGPALAAIVAPWLVACGMSAGAPTGGAELSAWITPATQGPESRCERRVTTPAPTRSVLEQPCGTVVAILTDGAHTARLVRTPRTFAEPSAAAPVQTRDWVRALPARFDGHVDAAIAQWLLAAAHDDSPDLLALSLQYIEGAPPLLDGGRQIAGDADYGPLSSLGVRIEGADFYDYLGTPWTFADGVREKPLADKLHSLDCSGYMRMLWGLRAGLPLASTGAAPGSGALSRRAVQMELAPFGVPISIDAAAAVTPDAGLQAGDLVFFDADPADGPAIDHVGMYLGRDERGSRRFISSRKGANGPTMGDVRGASILDGNGLYAKALRSARRL
jgi:cell wall-associated NlpC family hydrolase